MKKIAFLLISLLLVLMYQNFTSPVDSKKHQVNEKTRKRHAKELLGNMYKESPVGKFDKELVLNTEILIEVEKSLPKKFKNKAEKITKTILSESNRYDIDPIFLLSIIKTESDFNPLARGTSGEIGLMQLMPKTADYVAKKIKMKYRGAKTLRDPIKNIKLGAAYFDYLREKFGNRAYRYVPAYNVGPTKITKIDRRKDIPKIYSQKVIKHYEYFYKKIYMTQVERDPALADNRSPSEEDLALADNAIAKELNSVSAN